MFVRGMCLEKSDVKVCHFKGKMVKKVMSCVKARRWQETEGMSRTSFHDDSDGLVVIFVSCRVIVVAMSSSEDLVGEASPRRRQSASWSWMRKERESRGEGE